MTTHRLTAAAVLLAGCTCTNATDLSLFLEAREQQEVAREQLIVLAWKQRERLGMEERARPLADALGILLLTESPYSYYPAADGVADQRDGEPSASTRCPVTGEDGKPGRVGLTNDGFVLLAAANLDADDELDCWTVASFDRRTKSGRTVAGFVPYLEQADVPPPGRSMDVARFALLEEARASAGAAKDALCNHVDKHGELPEPLDAALGAAPKDPWGSAWAAAYTGEHGFEPTYLLVSAGPDRALATRDDHAFSFACEDARPRRLPAQGQLHRAEGGHLVVAPTPVTAPPNGTPAGGVTAEARAAAPPWVELPGGTFRFGCEAGACDRSIRPRHAATVATFALGKTEVSVEQYGRCVAAGSCPRPSDEPREDPNCNWDVAGKEQHPANCVTWRQAQAFCAWVGGRLPTAAEWEYAARGGNDRRYPWGDEAPTDRHARFQLPTDETDEWHSRGTAPVTAHPDGASAHGILNLGGNVDEWTATQWRSGVVEVRGGNFASDEWELRSSSVGGQFEAKGADDATGGFRCAQSW